MVDALASKTIAWEKERGIEFTYDGVSTCLLFLKPLRGVSLFILHAKRFIFVYFARYKVIPFVFIHARSETMLLVVYCYSGPSSFHA